MTPNMKIYLLSSFQILLYPSNTDPSDKTELDFGDCFGRETLVLLLNLTKLIYTFAVILG